MELQKVERKFRASVYSSAHNTKQLLCLRKTGSIETIQIHQLHTRTANVYSFVFTEFQEKYYWLKLFNYITTADSTPWFNSGFYTEGVYFETDDMLERWVKIWIYSSCGSELIRNTTWDTTEISVKQLHTGFIQWAVIFVPNTLNV